MNNAYNQIWLAVKWFFKDFCINMLTTPLGILKDTIDVINISWQLACLIGSVITIIVGFGIKYLKEWL